MQWIPILSREEIRTRVDNMEMFKDKDVEMPWYTDYHGKYDEP